MNNSIQNVKFILLDDLSGEFDFFIPQIETVIKEVDSNYQYTNLMPMHSEVSDFLKKYRDKKHGKQDKFPDDLKEVVGKLIAEHGTNIIFFIDVVWFNNNTAGLDFCTNYLWKTYAEIENKTIFLTVLPLTGNFVGHSHIDKNKLKINDESEQTKFKTEIIKIIETFKPKKTTPTKKKTTISDKPTTTAIGGAKNYEG
ncbi:MAG: hypothetical protein LBU51_11310 [Bacteroidales bacterium]|jgi:hypothetical protein|nr:hypothetical protein [Bacteroidales bacterium]